MWFLVVAFWTSCNGAPTTSPSYTRTDNVAFNKPAVLYPSQLGNYAAAQCVDGGKAGTFGPVSSCCHSSSGGAANKPYFMVDLGKEYRIRNIVLYNRVDSCCTDRLDYFQLYANNQSGVNPWTNAGQMFSCGNGGVTHPGSSVDVACAVTARYVYLKPGWGVQFCEMEVYPEHDPLASLSPTATPTTLTSSPTYGYDGVNLALGKNVEILPSYLTHHPPSRCVDGNTNGIFGGMSCCHSTGSNPYLSIDLGATYQLRNILIYNRRDSCCTEQLDNFQLFVSNVSNPGGPLPGLGVMHECAVGGSGKFGPSVSVACEVTAQFVIVKPVVSVQICEVMVFGQPETTDSPTKSPTITVNPTACPTSAPTSIHPTTSPTITVNPTAHPTSAPTSIHPTQTTACPTANVLTSSPISAMPTANPGTAAEVGCPSIL
jgi:hypothetical protein